MNIQKNESNGITQNNSVYFYDKNDKKLIFIDTPGHEDISTSRNKLITKNVCDVYLLIVSVKEGIKKEFIPTFESVRDTKSKIVVFITHADNEKDEIKYSKEIENIKNKFFDIQITPEDFSNSENAVPFICGSGVTGHNVDKLLELLSIIDTKNNFDNYSDFGIQVNSIFEPKNKHLPKYSDIVVRNGQFSKGDFIVTDHNAATIEKITDLEGNSYDTVDGLKPYRFFLKWLAKGFENSIFFEKITDKAEQYTIQSNINNYFTFLKDVKSASYENRKPLNITFFLKDSDFKNDIIKNINKINDSVPNSEFYLNIIGTNISIINEVDVRNAFDNKSIIIAHRIVPQSTINKEANKLGVKVLVSETIGEFFDSLTNLLKSNIVKTLQETGSATILKVFDKTKDSKERIIGVKNTSGTMNVNDKIMVLNKDGSMKNINLKISYFAHKTPGSTEFKKISEAKDGMEFTIIFKDFNNKDYDRYIKLLQAKSKEKNPNILANLNNQISLIKIDNIIQEGDKIVTLNLKEES